MAKEYELVGGQPVKVSPLEATESGTYYAPSGQVFNPVTVSGGGGGGIFWVTLTYDSDTSVYAANKSYNDILTALDNGQMVLGVVTETDGVMVVNNYYNLTDLGKLNDNSL